MTTQHPRRRSVLRAIGAAGTALLAGCGGDGPDGATESRATPPDGTATTDAPATTRSDPPTATPEPGLYLPADALQDEPIELRFEGAPPGATVTFRAAAVYPEGGPLSGQFESYARFTADEGGTVSAADRSPSAGTYEGTDPMGLFWSMRPRSELDDPGGFDLDGPTVDGDGRTVHLRAVVDGEVSAAATTRRRSVAPGVTSREPDGDVVGRLFIPPEGPPHPAAMVLHGGGASLPTAPARTLASHGIAAMAVQYFGGPESLPDRPVEIPLEYFEPAIDWLLDQPEVADGGVGVTGLSLGGTTALLVGATDDRVEAVVSTSATTVVFASEITGGESPFSLDGEPLPFVPATYEDGERRDGALATAPAFRAALDRASDEEVQAAMVPVEDVDGRVLFVTGEDDAVVDATAQAERSMARLDGAGVEFPYEHRSYEQAGHMITVPYGVTTQMIAVGDRLFGGTPAGLAAAEADAWPRVKTVLRRER